MGLIRIGEGAAKIPVPIRESFAGQLRWWIIDMRNRGREHPAWCGMLPTSLFAVSTRQRPSPTATSEDRGHSETQNDT